MGVERPQGRNDAYERAARRSDVRFIDLTDYRAFREVGLRGLTVGEPSVLEHVTAMARAMRCSPMLVTTGLRLEEAAFCSPPRFRLAAPARNGSGGSNFRRHQGGQGAWHIAAAPFVPMFDAYIAVERAAAVAKFARRRGCHHRPIRSTAPHSGCAHCISLAVARWIWRSSHRMNAQGLLFALTMARPAKQRCSG